MLTLAFLWGLVYAVVIGAMLIAVYVGGATLVSETFSIIVFPILIAVGMVTLQFLISPWLLDLNFRWLHKMSWIDP